MIQRIIAAFLFLCTFGSTLQAQDEPTEPEVYLDETGIWAGLYLTAHFSETFGYYGEHHYRARNAIDNVTSFVGRPRQIYNRFGLWIHFNDHFEGVIGPALIVNYTPNPGNPAYEAYTLEPRIWSQWVLMNKMGRVKILHQFRFEQRWKRKNDIGAEYKFTNRYRYKFYMYVPLNTPTIQPGTWFFSPSAEIFMHSGKSVVYNPFEDFRTYNGFGYVLNPMITFFAGHMWTIGQESTGYQYRTSHVFRFNVFIGLDFRKASDKLPKINLGY